MTADNNAKAAVLSSEFHTLERLYPADFLRTSYMQAPVIPSQCLHELCRGVISI